jgi:transposase
MACIGWLDGRFAAGTAEFALEGCTGWRYVAEELAGAGVGAHLADPAETAAARGRKRRAKTDKTDSRLLRELLAAGRLPECYIPPGHVLDCRAMLQAYHDLRQDRWAWAQRIHAVLFHQGAPPFRGLGTASGPAELTALAAGHLTAAGRRQVAIALAMHAAAGDQIEPLRADLIRAARQLAGARELTARLYGVGPVTALAITCWLGGAGRFASARQAVRFAGLDITVYSSAGKRAPGHL